ncbi:MAG: hypothetical protein ABIE07_02135 [Candidatus Zixiibacteriota bacterium]
MDLSNKRGETLLIIVFLLFYVIVVLRNAWTCDDAYISFRVIDNFVNGFGLRWNVAERVQAFTNPLWVFVLSPIYMITKNMYFTAISMSVLISFSAVALLAFRIARSLFSALLAILTLTLSSAFIDFSTSGLENPLAYLLMIIFLLIYFQFKYNYKWLATLSVIASLAIINRMDAALIYAPILGYAFWKVRGVTALKILIMGMLPLITWELFSLLYYGFPFPNTAYAKLCTGLDSTILWKQGFCYILSTIEFDPITFFIIICGVCIPLFFKEVRFIPISLGVVIYLIYVVKIGGCFMSGRHLAVPFLCSISILSRYKLKNQEKTLTLITGLILVAGLSVPRSPLYASGNDNTTNFELRNTINDERCYYNPSSGLLCYDEFARLWPSHGWAYEGEAARNSGLKFKVHGAIGMYGFWGGPELYVVDVHALSEPFLARLPVKKDVRYKMGHFRRAMPPGYLTTLETGKNVIADSNLAKYYDKLQLIVSGDIFDFERLKEIINFNLGEYDELIEAYELPHMKQAFFSDIATPRDEGTNWLDSRNIIFNDLGVRVILGEIYYSKKLEISRDHNDDLNIIFAMDTSAVDSLYLPAKIIPHGGLSISILEVPLKARQRGFDELHIFPVKGDNCYALGHIRFIDEE